MDDSTLCEWQKPTHQETKTHETVVEANDSSGRAPTMGHDLTLTGPTLALGVSGAHSTCDHCAVPSFSTLPSSGPLFFFSHFFFYHRLIPRSLGLGHGVRRTPPLETTHQPMFSRSAAYRNHLHFSTVYKSPPGCPGTCHLTFIPMPCSCQLSPGMDWRGVGNFPHGSS